MQMATMTLLFNSLSLPAGDSNAQYGTPKRIYAPWCYPVFVGKGEDVNALISDLDSHLNLGSLFLDLRFIKECVLVRPGGEAQ